MNVKGRWWSRRLLVGALALILGGFGYPLFKFGSAVYEAQMRERALLKCQLEAREPIGTKVITLETTDSGYVCVFSDKRGRFLGTAKP